MLLVEERVGSLFLEYRIKSVFSKRSVLERDLAYLSIYNRFKEVHVHCWLKDDRLVLGL